MIKTNSIKKQTSFVSNFINTSGSTILISILSLLSSILLSRALGPNGRGELTLIILYPTMILTFGRFGIGHSINFYASKVSKNTIIINSIFLSLVLGIGLFFISILTVSFLRPFFFKEINIDYLYFGCLLIPFLLLYDILPSLLQGLNKIKLRNLLYTLLALINFLLFFVFIILLDYGIWGGIMSYFISYFIVGILALWIVIKERDPKKNKFEFSFSKKLLIYGLKSHIGNIFKQLSYRGDILVVSYFLEAKWVGYYIVAVNIAEILWKLPEVLGVVLLPKIASENKINARRLTPIVFRALMYPMTLIVFCIFIFNRFIIILFYGVEFLPSVTALTIMLPGIFALSFWKIIATDLIAQGHALEYSITSGLAAISMIIFDFILIPLFDINGAALATSLSYTIATIYIIIKYLKVSENNFTDLIKPIKSDFVLYSFYYKKMISYIKFKKEEVSSDYK